MTEEADCPDSQLEETLLAACADRKDAPSVPNAVTERLFFVREQMERIDEPAPSGPCLLVSGPKLEPRWLPSNNRAWSIGRDACCDLVLADTRVSRCHASIDHNGDDWELRDLDSQNGVRRNGKKIDQALLSSGDVIEIADYALIFMD